MLIHVTKTTTETQNPKKKSWAEMADDADDEERIEKEEEEKEKARKIINKRKYLLSIGKYELEDGEILE
jgi:RNA polymerase-binding transcription factor DksA